MKVTQMTKEHLRNRINFFERKLKERPEEQYYMGDSDYAEQAVEQENRLNEELAEKITAHIKYMKSVLLLRKREKTI